MDMPSTNIASHFYSYVRDTCRFSSDSDAPAVIHLRNPRSGGTHGSTPIAFSVRGWTNGLLVSICACLAHMYTENQCWTHFTTLFTPVDAYREFRHTDPGFY